MNFGPNGEDIYRRTYSRTKPDGSKETWPETVERVVEGNLNLIGPKDGNRRIEITEEGDLKGLITDFSIIPAGRHLWASGVDGRQFLFNCWVSGWGDSIVDHFRFTFLRLMEGGGVGANYSSKNTEKYGPPLHSVEVHVVCDPSHPDYEDMKAEGLLSASYSSDYQGAYTEVEDSREGWADALSELLTAAWYATDKDVLVFDVSRVRWKGARLKTFGGFASGPGPLAKMLLDIADVINEIAPEFETSGPEIGREIVLGVELDPLSAMEIDHAIAQCVVAGGNRRSARMSILPWDDPWINRFIECKADSGLHWTTNISVLVNEGFFKGLDEEPDGGSDKARLVLEAVTNGMLTNGEPGFWNQSLSQVGEVGQVVSTNPCGEIALEEWEACNLGHINLANFVNPVGRFDYERAIEAARLITRFLIRATFGDITDPRSREIMDRNRRIGVGLLGVQEAFAKMGIKYSEVPETSDCETILEVLKFAVRDEAQKYAFQLRIPESVKVTTVAPTGTIAKMPGVSEGIHPIYAKYFIRRIRFATTDPDQMEQLGNYVKQGYHVEACQYAANTMVVEIPTKDRLVAAVEAMGWDEDIVESAEEFSIYELLDIQQFIQEVWADNAVSFTANIPEGWLSHGELKEALRMYLPTLKGTTIMPDGSRPQAPYERITKEQYEFYVSETGHEHTEESIDEECASGACPVR